MSKHTVTVTLTNEYHGTSASARLSPAPERWAKYGPHYLVPRRQALRLRRELCGSPDCTCGDTFGARGGIYLAVQTETYDREYVVRIDGE